MSIARYQFPTGGIRLKKGGYVSSGRNAAGGHGVVPQSAVEGEDGDIHLPRPKLPFSIPLY